MGPSSAALIDRRAFVGSLAGAVLATAAAAEPSHRRAGFRVGYLSPAAANALEESWLREFQAALGRRGYSGAAAITLVPRYADHRLERLPALATELLDLGVDVLLTFATPASLAAKAATRTIPIVMIAVGDPVGVGLVSSLNRPDANVTGLTLNNVDSAGKRLQFLKEAVPKLSRVAVLSNSKNPSFTRLQLAQIRAVAERLGVSVVPIEIAGPEYLTDGFDHMVAPGVNGLIVLPDASFITHRERIGQLALRHRLPSAAPASQFVSAGCLLAYGPDVAEIYRQAARFVDLIVQGTRPADLPIEQPTRYELSINLRTARILRLTIPRSLLLRADQVVEQAAAAPLALGAQI